MVVIRVSRVKFFRSWKLKPKPFEILSDCWSEERPQRVGALAHFIHEKKTPDHPQRILS
jgi:hypothetical protein